jgi:hypothetical protein
MSEVVMMLRRSPKPPSATFSQSANGAVGPGAARQISSPRVQFHVPA